MGMRGGDFDWKGKVSVITDALKISKKSDLMEKFRDIKGVDHFSECDRDLANLRYAQNEFRQTELLEKQAKLQAEHLRLAKESDVAQRTHHEKIEALAAKEAAETQAHRQFTQDVEWLERSDSSQRFEYLLKKHEDEIVPRLAEIVFEKSGLNTPEPVLRKELFKNTLAEWCEADLACRKKAGELERLQGSLTRATDSESSGCVGYFCFAAGLSMVAVTGLFMMLVDDAEKTDGIFWFLVALPGVLAIFLLRVWWRWGARKKKERAELLALRSIVETTTAQLSEMEEKRNGRVEGARNACLTWMAECRSSLEQAWHRLLAEGVLNGELKKMVGEFEKQFPVPLRVAWLSVNGQEIAHSAKSLEGKVLKFAEERYINLELLAAQFKAAKDFNLSGELAGNAMLAEVLPSRREGIVREGSRGGEDIQISGPGVPQVMKRDLDKLGNTLATADSEELKAMGFKESKCFIATACYGDGKHPAVMELRLFRDECLLVSGPGKALVQWYYGWSPLWAAVIGKRPVLKAMVRWVIVVPALMTGKMARRLRRRITRYG